MNQAPLALRIVVALVAPLLALQVAYMAWALARTQPVPAHCDLFAVFGGVPERIQRGIQLAAGMDAVAFVVSDSSADSVSAYLRDYGPPGQARILLEPRARHTVQNAWYVLRLAREHGFKRVVYATSWYHLPRAMLLMGLASAGSGIECVPLRTESVPRRWWGDPYFWLEFPKTWGSLGQWCVGSLLPPALGGK